MNEQLTLYQLTVIQAYRNILDEIKALLPQYPTRQMRTYIERGQVENVNPCEHFLYSPMLTLSLMIDDRDTVISFSRNHELRWRVPRQLETALIRTIYRHTEKTATAVNIEDCLEPLYYVDEILGEAEGMLRRRRKGYKRIVVKFKEA